MDIFILDRLPDGKAGAHTLVEQKAIYALAMGHRRKLNYQKYGIGQKGAVFLGSSAGKLLPMRKLFALQEKVARRANKKQTAEWYYSNYDPGYIDIRLPDAVAQGAHPDSLRGLHALHSEALRRGTHEDLRKLYGAPAEGRAASFPREHGDRDLWLRERKC